MGEQDKDDIERIRHYRYKKKKAASERLEFTNRKVQKYIPHHKRS
jgi:hypothetical protein